MLAIPGFIEGHGHFTGVGEFRMGLDLREARTWDEIVAQVARAVRQAKPGEWIIGRGWHQSKWTKAPEPNVEGFPASRVARQGVARQSRRADARERACVVCQRQGDAEAGHQARHDESLRRRDPEGHRAAIRRGCCGSARRVSLGRAEAAYNAKRTPAEIAAELRKQIELATDESLSKGITSFQDAGSPFSTVDALKAMAEKRELRMRIWMMLRAGNDALAPRLDRARTIGAGDNYFTVRAIKRQIDGALGSRGAWLLEPYSDKPDSSGLEYRGSRRYPRDRGAGDPARVSALRPRDRRSRQSRDARTSLRTRFKAHPDKKDLRWRVEHAQHLSAADIPRFGQLGVIAAMQGIHCTSDAPYVLLRSGAKRAEEGAYVWQKLMKSGAVVGNGTDAPVEDVSPLACFYATVSRKLKDGTVFYPDQRMSPPGGVEVVHREQRVRGVRGESQGLARSRQTGRRDGAVARHHDDSRRRDPVDRRRLHDRRRQSALQAIGAAAASISDSCVPVRDLPGPHYPDIL